MTKHHPRSRFCAYIRPTSPQRSMRCLTFCGVMPGGMRETYTMPGEGPEAPENCFLRFLMGLSEGRLVRDGPASVEVAGLA